jgi:hypothetical protein
MSGPNLDSDAENLLNEYGYVWSAQLYACRRVRRVDRQSTEEYLAAAPVVVSYEELRDHGLVVPQYDSSAIPPTPTERRAAIQWLRSVLAGNESV